jgi:hypothetical protein
MKKLILIDVAVIASAVLLCGCNLAPLKGGRATTSGVIGQTVVQGDNPAQASRQDQETVKTRSYTVPAGSRLEEAHVTANAAGAAVTNVQAVVVSAPMPVVEHEETRAKTELGAAQKDTARELGAKLASLKGIVWVGVVLFLFGLATLFYPPLRLLIGSVTTSAAICAGGPRADYFADADRGQRTSDFGRRRCGSRPLVFSSSAWPIARIGGCEKGSFVNQIGVWVVCVGGCVGSCAARSTKLHKDAGQSRKGVKPHKTQQKRP